MGERGKGEVWQPLGGGGGAWGQGHREGDSCGRASGKRSSLRVRGSALDLSCKLVNLSSRLPLPRPPFRPRAAVGHTLLSPHPDRSPERECGTAEVPESAWDEGLFVFPLLKRNVHFKPF